VSHLLYKRRAGEVLLDTVLIVLCFYSAYLLRFEGILSLPTSQAVVHSLPIVMGSCLCACFCAGIYRGQWRLISLAELSCYATGVSLGTVLSLAMVTLVTRFDVGHSRSAYIIFGVLLFLALVGSRLSFRLFDALIVHEGARSVSTHQKPILIYGAGKAGKLLYEEMMFHPQMQEYVVVGFVDDDPHRVGYKLCGVPVKYGWEWLRQPWNRTPEIWVSSRSIPDECVVLLAVQWQERAVMRRRRLHMEPLLPNPGLLLSMGRSAEREQSSTSKDGTSQVL
jgi:FlaA1/EpsC-like NDP-sugar epimerase